MSITETSSSDTRSALRQRLDAFQIDDPEASFPFSARLARENGWSRCYTLRVIEEYKRFVYLAMTAGHPVTPSPDVDEAWHLHLTYTRSYWERFVPQVLGRALHHEPTRGGSAERANFVDWYARTLESYRAAFGAEPPAEIWPAPAPRFGRSARTRHVSTAIHRVIAGPRRWTAAALAAASLLLLAGCTLAEVWGAVWPILGALVFGCVLVALGILRGGTYGRGGRGTGASPLHSGDSTDSGNSGASGCSGCGGCCGA